MSVPGSRPANPAAASASLNLRGAVDLSSLKTPRTPASAPAAGEAPGGSGPVEVTEQNFPDLVQLSNRVPVVMNLWAPVSPQSSQLTDVLQKVADENPGRILVGSVDAQ